jgi:hypothetical protein
MRSSQGNLWLGWGAFCGIPATITAFGIGGPLGLLVLAGTVVAIVIGVRVERTRKTLDDLDEWNARR